MARCARRWVPGSWADQRSCSRTVLQPAPRSPGRSLRSLPGDQGPVWSTRVLRAVKGARCARVPSGAAPLDCPGPRGGTGSRSGRCLTHDAEQSRVDRLRSPAKRVALDGSWSSASRIIDQAPACGGLRAMSARRSATVERSATYPGSARCAGARQLADVAGRRGFSMAAGVGRSRARAASPGG